MNELRELHVYERWLLIKPAMERSVPQGVRMSVVMLSNISESAFRFLLFVLITVVWWTSHATFVEETETETGKTTRGPIFPIRSRGRRTCTLGRRAKLFVKLHPTGSSPGFRSMVDR